MEQMPFFSPAPRCAEPATNIHQGVPGAELECVRVEEEMTRLYAQISELQHLTPFSKLPSELLAEIFHHVVHSPDRSQGWPKSLATVTSVCRRWREVALRTASLWTTIGLTRFNRTKLLLERSQLAPLSLLESGTHDFDTLIIVLQNIHRFSSINTLFCPSWAKTPGVWDGQTLPLLEDVTFTYTPAVRRRSEPPMMPSLLDQCEVPNLQKLSLGGCMVNPSSPLFARSLTALKINSTAGLTIPTLVKILSNTPALRSLYISSYITGSNWEIHLSPTPPERRVSLPYLDKLTLTLPCESMVFVSILNQLELPTRTSLSLRFVLPDGVEDLRESFFQGLQPTLLGQNRVGPVVKYRSCLLDPFHLSIALDHKLRPVDIRPTDQMQITPGTAIRLYIQTRKNSNHSGLALPFFRMVRLCPLGDIESLYIKDYWGGSWDLCNPSCHRYWHSACALVPNVLSMKVRTGNNLSRSYYLEFLSKILLSPSIDDSDAEDGLFDEDATSTFELTHQLPVLPRLQTLLISRMKFTPEWMGALLEVLKARQSSGVSSIKRLLLKGCTVEARDVELLREVIGDIQIQ